MTSTARQLRQPPAIEAIERVPYFPDVNMGRGSKEGSGPGAGGGFFAARLLEVGY